MANTTILVTGANGQLGREIQAASANYPQHDFVFLSRSDLPVNEFEKVHDFLKNERPSFCINCAAYTAVDRAEAEKETAFLVNAESVGVLAAACKLLKCKFIHISTDYVFDGRSSIPLKEDDATNPINVYGASKLKGEELALKENDDTIIIRTSWVYSEFGSNFVKTMMKLMRERESINVVSDQIGSPTYAADLAVTVLDIINSGKFIPGIYNYSNKGQISWYDFAMAIKEMTDSGCKVNPVPTSQYPTAAMRPHYSLLDKAKISSVYQIVIREWKKSLSLCIAKIKKQES